jgi:hypothetical protein
MPASVRLPPGWTESRPGGLAANPDPVLGGIVDQVILTDEWFVVFNRHDFPVIDGLPTRDAAFDAFEQAIAARS